jgi:hypothetical protein
VIVLREQDARGDGRTTPEVVGSSTSRLPVPDAAA